MKHTVPDCMKPDGGEPCRGYADLRKEWISTIDAAHQAGEIHNNLRGGLERRIEELEKEVAGWRLIGEDLLITNKWNHNRVTRMMNMRKAREVK